MKEHLKIRLNGEDIDVYVEPWKTLQQLLHDELELTGTKSGCSSGRRGCCTVLLDEMAVKSCIVMAFQADGHELVTIEGLAGEELHPLQQTFIDHFAVQCGYCTPGMILSAKAILDEKPKASYEEIKAGLIGNLCRCTGYVKIMEAIIAARDKMNH